MPASLFAIYLERLWNMMRVKTFRYSESRLEPQSSWRLKYADCTDLASSHLMEGTLGTGDAFADYRVEFSARICVVKLRPACGGRETKHWCSASKHPIVFVNALHNSRSRDRSNTTSHSVQRIQTWHVRPEP